MAQIQLQKKRSEIVELPEKQLPFDKKVWPLLQ